MDLIFGILPFAGFIGAVIYYLRGEKKGIIGCLALAALGIAYLGVRAQDTTSEPASAQVAATSAPVDKHAVRQERLDYWNGVVGKLAVADLAITAARRSIEDGDTTKASQLLTDGQKQAAAAKDAAYQVPDGWDSVGEDLAASASALYDALGDLSEYLDDGKPSEGAAAARSSATANAAIIEATHRARTKFVALGGAWSDIEDIASREQSLAIHGIDGS